MKSILQPFACFPGVHRIMTCSYKFQPLFRTNFLHVAFSLFTAGGEKNILQPAVQVSQNLRWTSQYPAFSRRAPPKIPLTTTTFPCDPIRGSFPLDKNVFLQNITQAKWLLALQANCADSDRADESYAGRELNIRFCNKPGQSSSAYKRLQKPSQGVYIFTDYTLWLPRNPLTQLAFTIWGKSPRVKGPMRAKVNDNYKCFPPSLSQLLEHIF